MVVEQEVETVEDQRGIKRFLKGSSRSRFPFDRVVAVVVDASE